MTKVTLWLVFLFMQLFQTNMLFSQNSFQLKIGNAEFEERIFSCIEYIPNHCYYCCGNGYSNSEQGSGIILRINSNGDTLVKFININNNHPLLMKIFPDEKNNQIILVGEVFNNTINNYEQLIIGIDTICNIKWYKTIAFPPPFYSSDYNVLLLKKDGGFFLTGTIHNSNYTPVGLYIYDFNANYDTINSMYKYYNPDAPIPGSLTYNNDSTRLWVFGHGFLHNASVSQRLELDTNLNIIRLQNFLPDCNHYQYTRWVSDSTLFTAANYIANGPAPHEMDISLSIIDSAININPRLIIGTPDTVNYLAISEGMDFITPDSIFILADNHIFSFWPMEYNYMLLYLYSSTMQHYYTRYIGGDAYYTPTTLTATSDGGCLITSYRYDYNVNYYEHDIMIWKLNHEGLITGNDVHNRKILFKSIVYPNPVYDKFTVETAEPVGELSIFSVDGTFILKQKLEGKYTSIPFQQYASGTYIFIITYRDGSSENGKLVKL